MSRILYLRAPDAAALDAALLAAGLLVAYVDPAGRPATAARDDITLQVVGNVSEPTGETVERDGMSIPVMRELPGWHAVLLADLTDTQRQALADVLIDKPDYPLPTFAGVEDVPPTPPEPLPTLAEVQAALTAAATARRWDVETGGVVLPNGVRLNTGRGDQDAITRVIVNAGAAGLSEIPFKAASGWVTLSIDQLRGMASVIARHVQACYGRERVHHEAIAALQTVADAEAYDIGTGWPSNTEATA